MEHMQRIIDVQTQINEKMEKLGTYVIESSIATTDASLVDPEANPVEGNTIDIRQKIMDGESVFIIQGTYAIGEVAFSDRVLNPEKYEADNEFKMIVPTEVEIQRSIIEEKIKKAIAEGIDIADIDWDE